MARYAENWQPTHRSDRLIIEAETGNQPWFRRPIVIMGFAGAVIAIAAAIFIAGSGAGIDRTTTGAVDTVDPVLEGMAQFDGM